MDLITTGSFGKAMGTDRPSFEKLNNYLFKSLKLNQINELYSNHENESGIAFIGKIIEDLNIKLDISEEELKRIPKNGAFITVSNHPYGAIDGLILIYLICKKRGDFKAMANFLLEMVKPLSNNILPVNPFEKKKGLKGNIEGIRRGFEYLKKGHPIGIFPAGEVSTFQSIKSISDKVWNPSIIKFIKKAKVPVLPIYFHGSNSISFHILGLINANFRTAKLPSELLNKKNKTITIRIGNIINLKQQDSFKSTKDFGGFLRAKTYSLGTQLDVNTFFKYKQPYLKSHKKIIAPVEQILLLKDLYSLPEKAKLFSYGDYDIYCAETKIIPNIIKEIGRLREIAFRGVKEGTGKPLDIDPYDVYYNQLFIWDSVNEKLVGGYRIGFGAKILNAYGKKGFYLNTLFKFDKKLGDKLSKSIELGRSFVTPEYQKKAFPLFCLWKGILKVILSKSEYQYLIGPVTISNDFSNLSKNLMIDYIESNHFDSKLSKLVKPRKKYHVKYKSTDYKLFLQSSNDIKTLDSFIEDIEAGKLKVPILFKKYLQQNAKIIGFNRDPKFNNALDGLMLLDIYDIPSKTIKGLSKSDNEYKTIVKRFQAEYNHKFDCTPQY